MNQFEVMTAAVRGSVDARLTEVIDAVASRWSPHQPVPEVTDCLRQAVDGGKRARAVLVAIGAHLGRLGQVHATDTMTATVGAAVELFQASALVHDDIIDDAHTRRGRPATHRALAQVHRRQGWLGASDTFGVNGAIVLGDLLLSLACEQMGQAAAMCPRAHDGVRARALFDAMTAEVAYGQYLDVRAELGALPGAQATAAQHEQWARAAQAHALDVVLHKSARYSVSYPLLIGAALAGMDPRSAQWEHLQGFGEAVGVAFQLRDDELGTLGQTALTGKPVGEDLREGKRTVLLALTWQAATDEERALLRGVLARPDACAAEVEAACEVVRRRGAQAHEATIDRYCHRASEHLAALAREGCGGGAVALHAQDVDVLADVAAWLTHRSA